MISPVVVWWVEINTLHIQHSSKQSLSWFLNGTHLSPPNILLFILCLCNNLLTVDQRIKEYRDGETEWGSRLEVNTSRLEKEKNRWITIKIVEQSLGPGKVTVKD